MELKNDTRPEDRFVSAFELNEGQALNGTNAQLSGLRREALQHFSSLGFPHRKSEAYKYSPLRKTLQHEYAVQLAPPVDHVTESEIEDFLIPDLDAHRLVLVNGRLNEALSAIDALPEGVIVSSFARASDEHADLINRSFAQSADYERDVFVALNTAFTQDGVFVFVPKGTVVEKPIHVLHVTKTEDDLFIQPRNLFVAEQSAEVTIIQSHHALSDTRTFSNVVTEVTVGANAHVDHYKIQRAGAKASQVNSLNVYQTDDSLFDTTAVTLSGEVVRNNIHITADAEGCESRLYGLFLGEDEMHVDNSTLVDHTQPNCLSDELYKGVLDDASTGVFNGKVYVHPHAQKINAYQSNKSIILTEEADMYSKPELEIYADDVQCSHGATTGQLDKDALFYLRSRGLPEKQAQSMLLLAFARDIIDNIRVEPLQQLLDEAVIERFNRTTKATATRRQA